MTAGTVFVSILLILVVALAIRSIIRQKTSAGSCGGCCGSCAGCSGCHTIAGSQAGQRKAGDKIQR